MITIQTKDGQTTIYCLSTDTKPDYAENATALMEMDTGKVFLWDAENETWLPL